MRAALHRCFRLDGHRMNPRQKFTLRNVLIASHDLIMVVAALLVSCYFRFETYDFVLRLPLLIKVLPYFLVISAVVFYVFHLTTTKWRFISLVDALNIVKASSVLAFVVMVFDYVIIAPNLYGMFFLGKKTIILYWLLQIFLLAATRFTYRYFRYRRTLVPQRPVMQRRRSSSAAPRMPKFFSARSRAGQSSNCGRSACCRRRPLTSARRYVAFQCLEEWTTLMR